MDEIPRRSRVDQWTPAEKAIGAAVDAVEEAGCDPLLTDAVILLSEAKDRVADFVDGVPRKEEAAKTLGNTKVSQAQDNVSDLQVYGDGDLFRCLSKAWSEKEGWMKSTKAMNVPHGVVIQVTTQQGDHVAEALTYVPGCHVEAVDDNEYAILDRSEAEIEKEA